MVILFPHRFRVPLTALLVLALPSLAVAQIATTQRAVPRPAPDLLQSMRAPADLLVSTLTHGQDRVTRLFAGPDGLLGAVVEDAALKQDIIWLTPHASVVLAGPLLDAQGNDLTRQAKINMGLLLSPAATLKEAADAARHSLMVGTAGPTLTVFFDPNCTYCHQLYGQLAPVVAAEHVRVRYVVVGTLKVSSVPRAASLLAAADSAKALASNEKNYDAAHEEGGFPIDAKVDPALTKVVTANNALFQKAGMTGTPTILYCDKATRAVQQISGVPVNLTTFLAGVDDSACK